MFQHELFLDWETASEVDVTEVGTPVYFEHPSTHPLMLSWAIDDREVQLWEPDLCAMPDKLAAALLDPTFLKLAWNVDFERRGLIRFCNLDIPISQWFDVKVLARYCSLPGKLKEVGSALGLPADVCKMAEEGEKGIQLFSKPVRKGGRVTLFGIEPTFFNTRDNKPTEWAEFCEYCKRDTWFERYIWNGLKKFMPPEHEINLWRLDQTINQRGMPVAVHFVENSLKMALKSRENLFALLKEITGLENPNSDQQMLGWLNKQGYKATSMNKKVVKVELDTSTTLTPVARRALLIRRQFKRSSYTKLEAIMQRVSADGRIRDLFAFMAASRTGRWAGQDVQFQNLAKASKIFEDEKNLKRALELIDKCDFETAVAEFGAVIEIGGVKEKLPSVLDMVISCLRSMFQAKEGHILLVSDLSSIENRVLGWLAGCQAILDVFLKKQDSYKAFACLMYLIDYAAVTKEQRTVAKPAVLGCGYGLGPGVHYDADTDTYTIIWQCDECRQKFQDTEHRCLDEKGNPIGDLMKTGLLGYAENMGVNLTPEQAYKAWQAFRESYPEVPALWAGVERAAIQTMRTGKRHRPHVKVTGSFDEYREIPFVEFSRVKRKNGQYILRCRLPSGRYLHYLNARIRTEKKEGRRGEYEKHSLYYDGVGHGVGATTKQATWGPVYTYGGKLVENIVQAISRDILAHGMELAESVGMPIVGHVHDELIAEVKDEPYRATVEDLMACMSTVPEWAPGLPLGADGFEGKVYRK